MPGETVSVTTREPIGAEYSAAPSAVGNTTRRIASLDIVRGLIMVLMAIDHVRVYAGVPAGGRTAGVFFTRWVTNFSAPGFAFLAGTAAFLYARKVNDRWAVSRFLAMRGALLVLLELTVMRLSWTFNLDFAHYNLAGVLWMLGWCMILMAGLVWLPTAAIGALGLVMIFAQSVFGPIARALPHAVGAFLYGGGQTQLGAMPIDVLYVIVPWIGVMAAGYAFGVVTTWGAEKRRAACLWIGGLATMAFLVVGSAAALNGKAPADAPPVLFRILNQRKYPASPWFLLMTLGPTIALLPAAETMRGWFAKVMTTFGRVPLFFYLLHIPLIHALACLVSVARVGSVNPWLSANHPVEPGPAPPGYRWSLALVYLTLAAATALLYEPCRRYAQLKATGRYPWLRYL
ncbi:MAG: DUF1624 domain-containing protein [Gemmatimonadales bacterium]